MCGEQATVSYDLFNPKEGQMSFNVPGERPLIDDEFRQDSEVVRRRGWSVDQLPRDVDLFGRCVRSNQCVSVRLCPIGVDEAGAFLGAAVKEGE